MRLRLHIAALAVALSVVALGACATDDEPTASSGSERVVDVDGPSDERPTSTTERPEATSEAEAPEAQLGDATPSGDASAPPTTAPRSTTSPTTSTTPPVADRPIGIDPVSISIPSIGVDAPIIGLQLSGAEPEVPSDFDDTGWYEQTRRPGEIGPAVIAGHVDSRSGPAVFFRLRDLTEGDEIVVIGDSGETRTFAVVRTDRYPKDDLPPEVFGFGEPVPELRLITCGGDFDRSTGHYRDNQVVYARLVEA